MRRHRAGDCLIAMCRRRSERGRRPLWKNRSLIARCAMRQYRARRSTAGLDRRVATAHSISRGPLLPDTRASALPGFLRWQESSVRLIVIFIALVLIVGLAFVIRSRITNATLDSMQWVVAHARGQGDRVRARVVAERDGGVGVRGAVRSAVRAGRAPLRRSARALRAAPPEASRPDARQSRAAGTHRHAARAGRGARQAVRRRAARARRGSQQRSGAGPDDGGHALSDRRGAEGDRRRRGASRRRAPGHRRASRRDGRLDHRRGLVRPAPPARRDRLGLGEPAPAGDSPPKPRRARPSIARS